ncbi:MAG: M48 family metallopeptidase [Duncaniella sp.]|nr:M48 family metallopeptidase [Duncaniella sp.]MDE6465538.1 M48 family metallopeptidase [Duncaniella sp.]MDE6572226.1 M48 family metallopeptidase [Duncaniella sp.]
MAYTELRHPELGIVRISMRRNATRITGRWDNGKVLIITPPSVDGDTLHRAIRHMTAGLLAHRPDVARFETGRSLWLDGGVSFHFVRHVPLGTGIDVVRNGNEFRVRVGDRVDMLSPDTPGRISRLMIKCAAYCAAEIMIPRARDIASRLGLRPSRFSISRGHKVLGHCSSRGEIAFSSLCVFLTSELRDYIICHELAHLTEMNHSARFHALCDSYLSGREAELAARLRSYAWPVER